MSGRTLWTFADNLSRNALYIPQRTPSYPPEIRMHSRPSDLPDFAAPPVIEVVLGVQFDSLGRLLAPHLGVIWDEFKDRYPDAEQHAPLDPVFETFGEKGPRMPIPSLQLLATIPTPRVFFINKEKTQLIQVQRDRFYHNWRKIGDAGTYPRFERMLEAFEDGYRKLERVLAREILGYYRTQPVRGDLHQPDSIAGRTKLV